MLSALALLVAFLVGGVTLIPLLVAAFVGFVFYTSPVVHLPAKTGLPQVGSTTNDDDPVEPVTVYRAGWLTIRRTYEPWLDANATYVGALRSFMARDPRRAKPKDQFFAVLKQNTMFLYDNEEQVDCWAAIDVSAHQVVIYPEGNLDGELFVKRNAMCLRPIDVKGDVAFECHVASADKTHNMDPGQPLPWFLFARVNSDKEDWYHSLVMASKLGKVDSATTLEKDRLLFDPDDMAALVDGIDQQPDSIPMRWFNALIGRIFLAVYRTSTLEEYITSRIVRKLKRVKTPSMLSEIQVREVNVGSASPHFSKPMLKELTADGDASMEVHVSYIGDLRITIETVATINLGSHFKPYSVRLVLAVVLKELEGTMLLKIKRPPSNRIWFGFTTMPRMVLNVEPVVSTRQIKWSLITNPIASRIREVIQESLVLPHMDDISFFNSRPFFSRGGIWADALRKERNLDPTSLPLDPPAADGIAEGVEDDLTGEPIPIVVGQDRVEATTSAKEGATAARRRGRAGSEGDDQRAPSLTRAQLDATIPKRTDSTSTLSSFSLSSWREARSLKDGSAGLGAGDKRRTWFGSSRSGTSDSTGKTLSNSSQLSLASNSTLESPTSTVESGPAEVSAQRLRDVLTKRAVSRERERMQKERDSAVTPALDEEIVASRSVSSASLPSSTHTTESAPTLSALSLTAPAIGSVSNSITPSPSSSLASHNLLVPDQATEHDSGSINLLATPLSESPMASQEHLPNDTTSNSRSAPIESTMPLSTSPENSTVAAMVAVTTSSALAAAAVAAVASAEGKPPVPARPSFVTTAPATPPALPRRHQASQSVDATNSSSAYTTSSLLSSWRTKAADKQALAAGVAHAKDTMKRWGATWNTRRAGVGAEEDSNGVPSESPAQDGGRVIPVHDRSSSPGRSGATIPPMDSYRDYRASKSRNGDYFGASDSAPNTPPWPITMAQDATGQRRVREASNPSPGTSPRGALARRTSTSLSSSPSGHFTPAASSPTTKLSTAPTFASSSSSSSITNANAPRSPPAAMVTNAQPARTYKAATMMSIPGIRDETHRKAVASDHVSALDGPASSAEKIAASLPSGLPAVQAPDVPAPVITIDQENKAATPDIVPRPVPPPPTFTSKETTLEPPIDMVSKLEQVEPETTPRARPVPPPPLPPRHEQVSAAPPVPEKPAAAVAGISTLDSSTAGPKSAIVERERERDKETGIERHEEDRSSRQAREEAEGEGGEEEEVDAGWGLDDTFELDGEEEGDTGPSAVTGL